MRDSFNRWKTLSSLLPALLAAALVPACQDIEQDSGYEESHAPVVVHEEIRPAEDRGETIGVLNGVTIKEVTSHTSIDGTPVREYMFQLSELNYIDYTPGADYTVVYGGDGPFRRMGYVVLYPTDAQLEYSTMPDGVRLYASLAQDIGGRLFGADALPDDLQTEDSQEFLRSLASANFLLTNATRYYLRMGACDWYYPDAVASYIGVDTGDSEGSWRLRVTSSPEYLALEVVDWDLIGATGSFWPAMLVTSRNGASRVLSVDDADEQWIKRRALPSSREMLKTCFRLAEYCEFQWSQEITDVIEEAIAGASQRVVTVDGNIESDRAFELLEPWTHSAFLSWETQRTVIGDNPDKAKHQVHEFRISLDIYSVNLNLGDLYLMISGDCSVFDLDENRWALILAGSELSVNADLPPGAKKRIARIVLAAEALQGMEDDWPQSEVVHQALGEALPKLVDRKFSISVVHDGLSLNTYNLANANYVDLTVNWDVGSWELSAVLAQDGSCLIQDDTVGIKLLRKADGRMVIYTTQPFSGSLPDETKDLLRKLVGIEEPLGEPIFAGYEKALAELAKLADATDLPEAQVVDELPIFGKALTMIEL